MEECVNKQETENDWRAVMQDAIRLRVAILARRGGRPLPDPAEVISKMREERDEQLTGLK